MLTKKNDYTWHSNALRGIRGEVNEGNPQPGFYESRRKDKRTGKVDRQPVAYWHDTNTNELRCHRNGRDVDALDALDMWPFACMKPITDETYRNALAGKGWPDEAGSVSDYEATGDDGADPMEALAVAIKKAQADVKNFAKIESDEQLGQAQSLRSHLTTMAGKLDKAREALVRPHIDAQRDINGRWNPVIADAKAAANEVRRPMEAWESFKREAARQAQETAERIAREHAESIRKAADDGKPLPSLIPPEPPRSNAPAPATQIRGGGGRTASVSIWHEVIIDDEAAVYAYLKGNADLTALIAKLAQKATDAGLKVPGTHTVERTKIK